MKNSVKGMFRTKALVVAIAAAHASISAQAETSDITSCSSPVNGDTVQDLAYKCGDTPDPVVLNLDENGGLPAGPLPFGGVVVGGDAGDPEDTRTLTNAGLITNDVGETDNVVEEVGLLAINAPHATVVNEGDILLDPQIGEDETVGIDFANSSGQIVNEGNIEAAIGIFMDYEGEGAEEASVEVVNSGDIVADVFGIEARGVGSVEVNNEENAALHGDVAGIMGEELGSLVIDNSGELTGDFGIFGFDVGSLTVDNQGAIISDDAAVFAAIGDSLTVNNAGTMSAEDGMAAIFATQIEQLNIANQGEITGGDFGIRGEDVDSMTVENSTDGVITGSVFGVSGEEVGSLVVNNSGELTGGIAGIVGEDIGNLTVNNEGEISGEEAAVAAFLGESMTINNAGIMSVDGGIAVILATEVEQLQIANQGEITGGNLGIWGEDADSMTVENSAAGEIVGSLIGVLGDDIAEMIIDNEGLIAGDALGVLGEDIQSLQLDNSGTIEGGVIGAMFVGIGEDGPILFSEHEPLSVATINNSGSIAAVGEEGEDGMVGLSIDRFDSVQLTNAGDIEGGLEAGVLGEGMTTLEVDNSGLIEGGFFGASFEGGAGEDFMILSSEHDDASSASITNSGTIRAAGIEGNNGEDGEDGLAALLLDNFHSVDVNNSGLMEGGLVGALIEDFHTAEITNSGTITGDLVGLLLAEDRFGEDEAPVSVTNSGIITGGTVGIAIENGEDGGGTHTIVNSGLIASGGVEPEGLGEDFEPAAISLHFGQGSHLIVNNAGGIILGDIIGEFDGIVGEDGPGHSLTLSGGLLGAATDEEPQRVTGFTEIELGSADAATLFGSDVEFSGDGLLIQQRGTVAYAGSAHVAGGYTVEEGGLVDLLISDATPFYQEDGGFSNDALFHASELTFEEGSGLQLSMNAVTETVPEERRIYEALSADESIGGAEDLNVQVDNILFEVDEVISRDGDSRVDVAVRTLDAGDVLGGSGGNRAESRAASAAQLAFLNLDMDDPVREGFRNAAQTSPQALIEFARTLLPDYQGQLWRSSLDSNRHLHGHVGQRLGRGGASSGSSVSPGGLWLQAYGSSFDQDRTSAAQGFDGDSWGLTLGYDVAVEGGYTVGAALTYNDLEVTSDIARNKMETDGITLSAYGAMPLPNELQLSGHVSYGRYDTDTRRNIAGQQARGSYDSSLWNLRSEVSRAFALDGGHRLTPEVSFNYTRLSSDSYRERGSSAALAVGEQTLQEVLLGAGVEYAYHFETARGDLLIPSVGVGLEIDLKQDEVRPTSRFLVGGPTFSAPGHEPERDRYMVNLGLAYLTADNLSLEATYQYYTDSDFDSNTGAIRLRWDF